MEMTEYGKGGKPRSGVSTLHTLFGNPLGHKPRGLVRDPSRVSHGPVRIVAIRAADGSITTERGDGNVPSRLPVSGMQIPFRQLGLQACHRSMDIPICEISHDDGML